MLDDWSKEEGVEMVEIGSGLLVILLIFMLGLVAAVICFWPNLSPAMRGRIMKLCPYCTCCQDEVDDLESSSHSEMSSISSTHSTTPFTAGAYEQKRFSDPSQAPPIERSTILSNKPQYAQQSVTKQPPLHYSAPQDHPQERMTGTRVNPNHANTSSVDYAPYSSQPISSGPPPRSNIQSSQPSPPRKLVVNLPPPVSPSSKIPSQPPTSRSSVPVANKSYHSRGNSRGSSSAHQYSKNL